MGKTNRIAFLVVVVQGTRESSKTLLVLAGVGPAGAIR